MPIAKYEAMQYAYKREAFTSSIGLLKCNYLSTCRFVPIVLFASNNDKSYFFENLSVPEMTGKGEVKGETIQLF